MSVQGSTIKRVEFLTSRWEYDIPHKFVWAVDIYGVGKHNIDNVLNQYERQDQNREWPVENIISIEAIRQQLGFVGLAQAVAFPSEGFRIANSSVDNSGGLIQGIVANPRNPYGSENKLNITFLETNTDIFDYFMKPWTIAASHKGLIEDGDDSTNIKSTIEAYLYARSTNRDSVPTLRKHITFHKCVPMQVDADSVSYGDLSYENDLSRVVAFVFERYTVNNLHASPVFEDASTRVIRVTGDK